MNRTMNNFCMVPIDLYDKKKIYEGIKECDWLLADDKCVQRFVGIKWTSNYLKAPYVTIVCRSSQMAYAKQVAFALGKPIVRNSRNSVKMLRILNG